tara:strand:- start:577 stop:717 length:141 start_codon:yes stop_codon:yes gene_type:complete
MILTGYWLESLFSVGIRPNYKIPEQGLPEVKKKEKQMKLLFSYIKE